MAPSIPQLLLAFVALSAVSLLFATAVDQALFLPYHRDTSVLDFIVVAALLAGGALAVTTTVLPSSLSGLETSTTAVSVAAAVLWLAALTKAATVEWHTFSDGRRNTTAAIMIVVPVVMGLAAWIQRAALRTARAEQDAVAEKYRKLLDRKDGVQEGEAEATAGFDSEDGKAKKLSVWQVISTLKPYFWPRQQKGRIAVCLTWAFVAGSKVAGVIAPLYIAKATNALTEGDIKGSMIASIGYGCLLFAAKVLKEFQGLVYLGVSQAAFTDLSEDVFCHVHELSLQWHLKKKLGEVVRVIDRGISACDTFMNYGVLYLGPAIFECLSVVVLFFAYFNVPILAGVVLVCLAAYTDLTIRLTNWRKVFRSSMNKQDNKWHDRLTDSLVNFETVKYFTNEAYEAKEFTAAVASYQSYSLDVKASLSVLNLTQQLILNGCLAVSLVLAAQAYHTGAMNVGDFVAVGIWIVQLFTPLNFLGTVYNSLISAWVDLSNLSELLSQQPDLVDAPGALDLTKDLAQRRLFNTHQHYNDGGNGVATSSSSSSVVVTSPVIAADDDNDADVKNANEHPASTAAMSTAHRGEGRGSGSKRASSKVGITFDQVHFAYPSGSGRGLHGVSFHVAPGTTTALVGTTGAGKTTCGRLLFRFMDPQSGSVLVGQRDVTTVTQASLRHTIGVVPQDTVLFNDTIYHNVLYGNLSATKEEVEAAAKGAQILDFIRSLPEGWDTMVGERGLKLSGGEKQRVAIARCLLKDPPVVLLDEATSALDSVTEKGVQDALTALGQARTVLVIAHRLGTVVNADEIVVLGQGEVLERGTHGELLAKNGVYARMWAMQVEAAQGGGGESESAEAH